MSQRLVPFALKTCVVLMGAAWLAPLAAAHAQTTVNYNFEDGVLRGTPTQMKVPPKILTETGKKFMRITGSTGDCQSIPSNLCPPKNRSTVWMTAKYSSMPLLSSANMRQTYSADIRFHDNTGSDGSVFELFQDGPETGGYGTPDGQGPVVRFRRVNGKVSFISLYANETKSTQVERVVPAGSWHNYKVVAVWSHDPAVGRLEFYFDNVKIMTVSGRDVNLGPTSNRIPALKFGLYGDYATGVVDVDNVKAGPSSGASPAPSVALNAPANVRVVSAP
jgi:Polysaccharide lyase